MAKIGKQTPNIFANAQAVPGKAKTGSNKKAPEFGVEGIAEYAAYDAIITTVEGLKATARVEINEAVLDRFVQETVRIGRQPDNFNAVEALASANCQLKKRSTLSALSDEQVGVLDDLGIPYDTMADRPDTFIFNEKHIKDPKVMETVSKVLGPLIAKGALPEDIIQKQDATTKRVVTDETLHEVFKKDEDTLRTVLPIVTTIAVKPTTTEDIVSCISRLIETLAEDKEQARAALQEALIKSAQAA